MYFRTYTFMTNLCLLERSNKKMAEIQHRDETKQHPVKDGSDPLYSISLIWIDLGIAGQTNPYSFTMILFFFFFSVTLEKDASVGCLKVFSLLDSFTFDTFAFQELTELYRKTQQDYYIDRIDRFYFLPTYLGT